MMILPVPIGDEMMRESERETSIRSTLFAPLRLRKLQKHNMARCEGTARSQSAEHPANSTPISIAHLVLDLLGTAQQTSSPGGDETGLLTLYGVAVDGRGLSDMLVVTTSVRLRIVSVCVISDMCICRN